MNSRAVLALIAGILALHILVISLIIASGRTENGAGESVREPEKQGRTDSNYSTAPFFQTQQDAPNGEASEFQAMVLGKQKGNQKSGVLRSLLHVPLDYRSARRGTLKELPLSARAGSGLLFEPETRKVLWAKNHDQAFAIASLSKIMTQLLAYEATLKDASNITLQSPVKVSAAAEAIPPSKVGLRRGETFTLEELLIASSVRSANDAAYQIAEFIGAGSVDAFVAQMNLRARELGMNATKFYNPHGLPGKNKQLDNASSPEDLAKLAEQYLLYPKLLEWSSMRFADFRDKNHKEYIRMQNHNNLLPGQRYAYPGVKGIKTGYTARAGFCLILICEKNGKTLLAVMTGFPSLSDRDHFARQLLDWGFEKILPPKK